VLHVHAARVLRTGLYRASLGADEGNAKFLAFFQGLFKNKIARPGRTNDQQHKRDTKDQSPARFRFGMTAHRLKRKPVPTLWYGLIGKIRRRHAYISLTYNFEILHLLNWRYPKYLKTGRNDEGHALEQRQAGLRYVRVVGDYKAQVGVVLAFVPEAMEARS
jgi:hypothetical protein